MSGVLSESGETHWRHFDTDGGDVPARHPRRTSVSVPGRLPDSDVSDCGRGTVPTEPSPPLKGVPDEWTPSFPLHPSSPSTTTPTPSVSSCGSHRRKWAPPWTSHCPPLPVHVGVGNPTGSDRVGTRTEVPFGTRNQKPSTPYPFSWVCDLQSVWTQVQDGDGRWTRLK